MINSVPNKPQNLLLDHLDLLANLDRSLPILDLACGTGRNGLMLARVARAGGLDVCRTDHLDRHDGFGDTGTFTGNDDFCQFER
jgi:hypothetical protein